MSVVGLQRLKRRVAMNAESWVRVDSVSRVPKGLSLVLTILEKRRGPRDSRWTVRCTGVREFQISDLNGGGWQVYDRFHPAARQYSDPQVKIHVQRPAKNPVVASMALLVAHKQLADDWIPPDRYLGPAARMPELLSLSRRVLCTAPRFLAKAYASALRGAGVQITISAPRVTTGGGSLRVVHFGESFAITRDVDAECLD